jgi:hypothetical protein
MRYKIVITEKGTEVLTRGKDWEQGVKPITEEDSGGWGYTPEIQKTVDVERQVFMQEVEGLNLKAVINAINKE